MYANVDTVQSILYAEAMDIIRTPGVLRIECDYNLASRAYDFYFIIEDYLPKRWEYKSSLAEEDFQEKPRIVAMGRAAGHAIKGAMQGHGLKQTINYLINSHNPLALEKHSASDGEVWVLTWKD